MSRYLLKSDNYETPEWAVVQLVAALRLPEGFKIWCPFHGIHGQMIRVLKEQGLNVVNSEDLDFFDEKSVPEDFDIIIDNPPFSTMQRIVPRALSFGKPVILILPLLNLRTKWIKNATREANAHFINAIPTKRINYDYEGKETKYNTQETCWFCWRTQNLWKEENGQVFL